MSLFTFALLLILLLLIHYCYITAYALFIIVITYLLCHMRINSC